MEDEVYKNLFIVAEDGSLAKVDESVDLRKLKDFQGDRFPLLWSTSLVIFHRRKDVVYRLKPRKLKALFTRAPDPDRFEEHWVTHSAMFGGEQLIISIVDDGEEFGLAGIHFSWKDDQITTIP